MDTIFDSITAGDIFLAIISLIAGAVVGIPLGYYAPMYLKRRDDRRRAEELRKKNQEDSDQSQQETDVFVIESADPQNGQFFDFNDIEMFDSKKQLIIGIPSEYRETIRSYDPKWEFRETISFKGANDLNELNSTTGIPDLTRRIEKHARIICDLIIQKKQKNQTIFNGAGIGMLNISRNRHSSDERSVINISIYHCDYFTQLVFGSVYDELREEGHEISKITKLEEIKHRYDYSPFTRGLAVACFVMPETRDSLILAQRSEHIYGEQKRWHYCVDEGVAPTDQTAGKPDLLSAFYRGLRQEMNIDENLTRSGVLKIMDFVFHRRVFEFEFTAILFLKNCSFYDINQKFSTAKDRHLEHHSLTEVRLDKSSVNSFIKNYETSVGCKFSLKLARNRYEKSHFAEWDQK